MALLDLLFGAGGRSLVRDAARGYEGARVGKTRADQMVFQESERKRKLAAEEAAIARQAAIDALNARNVESQIAARGRPPASASQAAGRVVENEAGEYVLINPTTGASTPTGIKAPPPREPASAEPSWQTLQTPEGAFQVNPKTGSVRPVELPGGGRAAPRVSPGITKAIAENERQMSVIDDAIAEIDQYPEALGKKNVFPDIAMQRWNPKGIKARAAVADVGSLLIHDRSGAAVTASEAPRLMPFIPRTTDTPEAARLKLARLRKAIEAETAAMQEAFGPTRAIPNETQTKSAKYKENPY